METIAQVIKYEGDNNTFVWKHPIEDFNTGTQLIVHESQEAVFFMNGQALDLFGPGRHLLESQNLPYLSRFLKHPMGDRTPFHCEVYYINRTEQMAVKWGTDSKVEYLEPSYQFPIKIGASGEMTLRVEDSRKLLVKVVGSEHGISQSELVQKFRAFLMTRVKTYLVRMIRDRKLDIFEIDAYLTEMSESLRLVIAPDFLDYGVVLEKFFVTTIVKPEEDRAYQKFKELHFRNYADVAEARLLQQVGVIEQQTMAQRMVIESQGLAQKRTLEGYSYRDERGFDVAEKIAQNEAVGGFTNIGTGLGMMVGVGGAVGSTVGGMVNQTLGQFQQPQQPQQPGGGGNTGDGGSGAQEGVFGPSGPAETVPCIACGSRIPRTAKFCPKCGVLQKRKCPGCGVELSTVEKFCPECGQKL
jgi:membrane protease subunit (stomatin/prohibitin family)